MVGSITAILRINPTTQSAENLSSNMAKDAEVGVGDDSDDWNKIIQRLTYAFKSNKETGYLNPDVKKLLLNWSKHLPKRQPFKILTQNGILKLKLMIQAILLIES